MVEINVTSDVRKAQKDLKSIKASLPRITARALNETATWARRETIVETAKELRLPQKAIRTTTRRGVPADRFRLVPANPGRLVAALNVQSSGIQVTDVAQAWIGRKPGQKGGVRAKGGRFYRGAFKAPAPGGKVRVFKRRGTARTPLFLPRIGTRKAMQQAFTARVASAAGAETFRARFNRLANLELARLGR